MEVDLELYREELLISENPPVRLSYIEVAPENPAGTMVFIHGYGGYAMQWKNQLKAFSDNYRVIAYDLRGHGRSDAPFTSYTMADTQADLDTLLEKLDVKLPFILVGHSFGGAVVTEFAHRRPADVAHLVLIATAGEYPLHPAAVAALRLPLAVLRPISGLIRTQMAAEAHVLKNIYFNNMSKWYGWSMFRDLRMPVLVIRGERDQVFPAAVFEEVARAIPDAEDVNIGVSSHLVPLERADAVNRAIVRFIGGQPDEPSWWGKHRSPDALSDRPWLKHYESSLMPNVTGWQTPCARWVSKKVHGSWCCCPIPRSSSSPIMRF
jgi:pimeloyl-ACP methyl ester carboxylesterase